MSDEVIRLPSVRKKIPHDDDIALTVVHDYSCTHRWFKVDETKEEVTCGECSERLNPIWVLRNLAVKESNLAQRRDGLVQKVKELASRLKYKCGHCGKVNDVSKTLRFRAQSERPK